MTAENKLYKDLLVSIQIDTETGERHFIVVDESNRLLRATRDVDEVAELFTYVK